MVVADFDIFVVADALRLVVVDALGTAVFHMDAVVALGVLVDFLPPVVILEGQLVETLALVRVGAEDALSLVGGK